jgi:hypothetical protein
MYKNLATPQLLSLYLIKLIIQPDGMFIKDDARFAVRAASYCPHSMASFKCLPQKV